MWARKETLSAVAALLLVSTFLSLCLMPSWFPERDALEISYRMNAEKARRVDEVLSQIPPHASVLASFNVLYRLAGRERIGWLRHAYRGHWDYVVLDAELMTAVPPDFEKFLSENGYVLIWREGGFMLFESPVPR